MSPSDPSRGRPDRTATVLETTLELAKEEGYAKLSIERIAARAGVGKHTIYRRWPSKGAVFLDALLSALRTDLSYPDTGDIVADLRTQMSAARTLLGPDAYGPLYAALVGEAQHDPAIATALYERWLQPLTKGTQNRLREAQEQGQLSPDADLDVVVAVLYGPLYYRFLLVPGSYDDRFVDGVLEAVFTGLRPAPEPTTGKGNSSST
ncbi:TetR/AcrR family transcriptional regulator [Streptomyces sp. NPDC020875]|uniref:TetR/AcrR family transcriptional regulator n=1 Tax=Streptomyces sp. NPDC020875 TaxID=3154898 RepID=UPI0033F91269